MGNSGSTPKVSAQDKAVLDLKIQRDKLQQYQRRLAPLVAQYHSVALRHLAADDKPRALLALRRKKYHESLVSKADAQLAQLEQLTGDVEFALVQKDVFFGLQRGTEVLKEIRREMGGLEGVERLVGEGAEERAFQAEVAEMLAGRMTVEEEEQVEEELAALERREAAAQAAAVRPGKVPQSAVVDLPQVPADDIKQGVTTPQGAREKEPQAASGRRREMLPA